MTCSALNIRSCLTENAKISLFKVNFQILQGSRLAMQMGVPAREGLQPHSCGGLLGAPLPAEKSSTLKVPTSAADHRQMP